MPCHETHKKGQEATPCQRQQQRTASLRQLPIVGEGAAAAIGYAVPVTCTFFHEHTTCIAHP